MRRLVTMIALISALASAAVWFASGSPALREVVRARVAAELGAALAADVTLAGVSGTLGHSLVLHDLRLALDGRTVARVPRVEVIYAPLALLRGRIHLRRVTVHAPWLRLPPRAAGWNLPPRGDLPLVVDRLEVSNGRIGIPPTALTPRFAATDLHLRATVRTDAGGLALHLASLTFRPRGIAVSPVEAAGDVVAHGNGAIDIAQLRIATARSRVEVSGHAAPNTGIAARLALLPVRAAELRAFVPALDLRADVHATVQASGPWRHVTAALTAALGPAGTARATAVLDLTRRPPAYSATVALGSVDPAALWAGLPQGRLSGRAHARGHGVGAGAALRWRVLLGPSRLAGQELARVAVIGETARHRTRARGRLAGAAGTAVVRAQVRHSDPPRYRAVARIALPRLEVLAAGLSGSVGGRLVVRGRGFEVAANRTADLRVLLFPGRVAGVDVRGGRVTARLDGTTLRVDEALLDGAAGSASGGGTVDLAGRTADLALAATTDLSALGAPVEGSVDLQARVRGRLADLALSARVTSTGPRHRLALTVARAAPGLTGEVQDLVLTPSTGAAWHLARPVRVTADLAGGLAAVSADELALTAGAQRIAVRGRVGVRGSSDATVTLDRIDAAWLAALAHLPPASGTLSGRLALAGTGSAPRASAQITVTDLNVEGIPYGTLTLDVTAADGRATVHGGLRHPAAGELRADGTVPASLAWVDPRPARRDAPVDVRLHADALDASALRVLAPDAVRRIGGRLAIDARVHGPWSALGVDGTAALSAGRLELVATGVPYEDVRVRLRAAGRTVDVIELHARAGTGSADGQGRVLLPGSTPSVLDVRVALREFLAVRAPEYEGDVSGTLLVRGGLFVPEVVGDLDVVRALLRPAALPATGPPLARDPTITVVGLPAGPATTPASTGSLADALRLALDIRLTREVWIRRDDAGIELGGALRLDKSAGGPVRLNGEVRLVRGWYAFQGRRFTLEPDGTVRFTGPLPPHPALDVTATYRAPQYRILVHVGGTSEKPSLTLTSDPPLAEADILSVLLFGKPASELGRSESLGLQRQALQLASGYVAPELRTSVLDALALETLDVELPGGPDRPGGPDQPGRVSVGRHVASDVFLSLAQEFGGRNAQLVGVEYALTPRISVKGSTSTRGDTAVDVFWHRRY